MKLKLSGSQIHDLKTWPPFYQDIVSGIKSFELRKDDRDFEIGDVLLLREYDNDQSKYTGRSMTRVILYKLSGGQFSGIERGYCILGLGVLPQYIELSELVATGAQQAQGMPARAVTERK